MKVFHFLGLALAGGLEWAEIQKNAKDRLKFTHALRRVSMR